MPASFSVDAYLGETFSGRVRQIGNAPQTVQNIVTYDAVIDVENAQLKLRPGDVLITGTLGDEGAPRRGLLWRRCE